MNAGRIEQADTPEALYAAPRTPFVADFIGGATVLPCKIRGEVRPGLWLAETDLGTFEAETHRPPDARHTHLCWRPEQVEIAESGVPAQVIDRAFQGAFTDLTVQSGALTHRVQLPQTSLRVGDKIHLKIAPQHVTLLGEAQ